MLIGSVADDDPHGWEMYRLIMTESAQDPDIRVFTNLNGVGAHEVNAFQTAANVVIQKSVRDGFGMVVSEDVWKGTPVVGGNTGGGPPSDPECERRVFGRFCARDGREDDVPTDEPRRGSARSSGGPRSDQRAVPDTTACTRRAAAPGGSGIAGLFRGWKDSCGLRTRKEASDVDQSNGLAH